MKSFRSSSSSSFLLLLLFLSLTLSPATVSRAAPDILLKGVDIQNPAIEVTPPRVYGHTNKDVLLCERIKVSGRSRLELGSYASSFRVSLAPSTVIPERHHSKIQVCFHRNASLGLCRCELDQWKTLQKGLWSTVMSPYEERYVDVKFIAEISGSVTVSVEEDSQLWRLLCLCLGFLLLLLAPVISSWVPFYYSTSMAIGIFLVILVLLFQGMKLMPTAKKSILYLSLYSSVVGVGTYVLHYISMVVNSILVNFGLSEEMHNPVYVFLAVGIILAGAALGYWMVRKFIISEDGSVDVGVAQFVKWAMRILGSTFILQSTLDPPLVLVAWLSCCGICLLIDRLWRSVCQRCPRHGHPHLQSAGKSTRMQNRAEFLSRPRKMSPGVNMWSGARSSPAWSNSPIKGVISPSSSSRTRDQQDHYSTFHKIPNRKKMSEEEWKDSTRESTRQALAEWAGSPEFSNWLIDNADRIQLLPSDCSSEDSTASGSESTDQNNVGSARRFGLFSS